MKKYLLPMTAAGMMLLSAACSKNDVSSVDTSNDGSFKVFTQGSITTVQNLMADTIVGFASSGQPVGSGEYTFFSLERGALVNHADSASLRWDIAVRGTSVLVNAGSSGPGQAGAFIWVGAFDQLNQVPADSVFRTDQAPVYAIPTGSGKGWYNYDGASNLVSPLPGRVLVIKTVNGKYAKLEILNYYRGGITPSANASDALKLSEQRYYSFRYQLQPDGTAKF